MDLQICKICQEPLINKWTNTISIIIDPAIGKIFEEQNLSIDNMNNIKKKKTCNISHVPTLYAAYIFGFFALAQGSLQAFVDKKLTLRLITL